ncbi:protein S100-A2-like [Pleurodeles waltl]|uniref:protein S100-A2-like n=1 Tax=Pleurodeles waltl TaxID=8319 RepID=UPI0037096129
MNLEEVICKMIEKFDKYAGEDKDSRTLSQPELIKLAKAEFPTLSKIDKSGDVLKGICGKMDLDGDKFVDFQEYGIFLISIACILRESGCSR